MSLLPDECDISKDARRVCGQQIEDTEEGQGSRTNDSHGKRQRQDEPSASGSQELDHTYAENPLSSLTQAKPDNINDLCPEVFQIIIAQFLKQNNWRKLISLRLVCKFWRENVDSYLSSRHGFQYTGRLTKGSPPPVMNYYELNAMLSFYPNLRQLIVKNFTVSDHLIAILRQNVPDVHRLSLYGCRNLSWKGITILSVRYPQLKFLDASYCDLDENRLSILVENLRNLKIINAIDPGREVTGQCLDKLGDQIQDIWIGLNHLKDVNPTLKSLVSGHGKNILHLGLIVGNFKTTEWSIITNNMQQLKSLKLTFGSFENSSLEELAKLKNLEFLVLAEDSRSHTESVLTDTALSLVLKGCRQLKSLAIAGTKPNTCRFGYPSMSLISYYCPKMEQIRFLNANNIDNQCLIQMSQIRNLLVLHLSSMNAITNQGVVGFLKQSKKTRNLRISDCPNVNEDIIDTLIEVANDRSSDKIKISLEGMNITKSLDDLPSNLNIVVKTESEEAPIPCPNPTIPEPTQGPALNQ